MIPDWFQVCFMAGEVFEPKGMGNLVVHGTRAERWKRALESWQRDGTARARKPGGGLFLPGSAAGVASQCMLWGGKHEETHSTLRMTFVIGSFFSEMECF
eukprot:RCo039167